jgi:2-dehydropantoate 2-reductase
VRELAALLDRAGLEGRAVRQIQKDIWFKLWGNMTMNPISAITGATTDRVLDDELVRGFIHAVMLEAKEIGARIGIPIDQSPETGMPSRASWAPSRLRCCRTWKPARRWNSTHW